MAKKIGEYVVKELTVGEYHELQLMPDLLLISKCVSYLDGTKIKPSALTSMPLSEYQKLHVEVSKFLEEKPEEEQGDNAPAIDSLKNLGFKYG